MEICTFYRSCPTSAKCTISIRHGRNMGLGPWGPLGSNFGPTWLQHGETWPQLGPISRATSPQVEAGFKMGAWPTQNEILKTPQIGSFRLNLSQGRPSFGFGWAKSARFRHPASLTKILHERCPSFVFHSAPASLPIPAISPHGSMSLQISCLSNSLDAGGTRRGVTRICIRSYLVLLVCFAKTVYLPPDQVAAWRSSPLDSLLRNS